MTHHRQVGVHGVELKVDLLVHSLLGLLVVVLAYLRSHGYMEKRARIKSLDLNGTVDIEQLT